MPPSDEKFSDEERPTEPDLMAHECPHCRGAGGFLVAVPPKGHRAVACAYCKGKRRVSAAQNRSYRERAAQERRLSSRPKLPAAKAPPKKPK